LTPNLSDALRCDRERGGRPKQAGQPTVKPVPVTDRSLARLTEVRQRLKELDPLITEWMDLTNEELAFELNLYGTDASKP
jgi:hypothetical protein